MVARGQPWPRLHVLRTRLWQHLADFGAPCLQNRQIVLEPDDLSALHGRGVAERKKYLQERARSAKPLNLPEIVSKSVAAAMTRTGVVQPLPIHTDILHAQRRGATTSVMREKISSWLHSKDGFMWQLERKELFSGDGDCSGDAALDEAPEPPV